MTDAPKRPLSAADLRNMVARVKDMVADLHPHDVFRVMSHSGVLHTLVANDLLKGQLAIAAEMPSTIEGQIAIQAARMFVEGLVNPSASIAWKKNYADPVSSGMLTAINVSVVPVSIRDGVKVELVTKNGDVVDGKVVECR